MGKRTLARIVVTAAAAAAAFVTPAWAACSGTSPNLTAPTWTDVAACHTAAANGDTITVSAGTYDVTVATSITKHVAIQASGTVTLTNSISGGGILLTVTESTAGSTRVQGFTWTLGGGTGTGYVLKLVNAASGKPILVNGNTFQRATDGGPDGIKVETNKGVIYANTFKSTRVGDGGGRVTIISEMLQPKGAPATSWSTAATWGTADTTGESNLYIENNDFLDVRQVVDFDDNARAVFRRNRLTNSTLVSHGADTSPDGMRHVEILDNVWTLDDSGDHCDLNGGTPFLNLIAWINIRGGSYVVTDNTIPNIPSNLCGFFGDVSEITLQVQNIHRSTGMAVNPCWGTTTPGVYPVPRQAGQGHNGTDFITDPIYIWNNTSLPASQPELFPYSPNECGGGAPALTDYLQVDRDFVKSARPSYTKYQYPHPLIAASSPVTVRGGIIGGTVTIR